MIIDERMSAFIDSLDSGNPAWLNEIEKYISVYTDDLAIIRTASAVDLSCLKYHIFNREIKDFLLIALSCQNRNTEGTHEMSVLIHDDIAAQRLLKSLHNTDILAHTALEYNR